MKIVTWNVNGIRARFTEVVDLVRAEAPDVVCLQEIKAAPEQVPGVLFELGDYVHYWHGAAGGYSGVSVHVRRALCAEAPVFTHPSFDLETRIVVASFGGIDVASVYVPNGNKDFPAKLTFLREFVAYVEARPAGRPLVICGDLNVARETKDVHPSQRRAVIGQLPEERELFASLLRSGFTDVGRGLAPDDERLFTWWPYWRNAREKNVGWRLDYVLASSLDLTTATCRVLREFGTSDHGPVVAEIDVRVR